MEPWMEQPWLMYLFPTINLDINYWLIMISQSWRKQKPKNDLCPSQIGPMQADLQTRPIKSITRSSPPVCPSILRRHFLRRVRGRPIDRAVLNPQSKKGKKKEKEKRIKNKKKKRIKCHDTEDQGKSLTCWSSLAGSRGHSLLTSCSSPTVSPNGIPTGWTFHLLAQFSSFCPRNEVRHEGGLLRLSIPLE